MFKAENIKGKKQNVLTASVKLDKVEQRKAQKCPKMAFGSGPRYSTGGKQNR